jgi:hypothetical protein
MSARNDDQAPRATLLEEFMATIRRLRAARRRKLVARRAGMMPRHLRRDLGFEPGIDMTMAVGASAPAHLVNAVAGPLADHTFPPHDWPVSSANDNISWQPKRSWLALA